MKTEKDFYRNAALVAGRALFTNDSRIGGFDFFQAVSDVVSAPVKVARDASKEISKVAKQIPGVGNTLSQLTDIQGHLQTVERVVKDASDLAKNIPAIGDPLSKMISIPGLKTINGVLNNQRLDKALIEDFKRTAEQVVGEVILASKFVSFVPGVGSGVAAGIGASAALVEGKPIDEAFIEAVSSAIPGGALAKGAFNIAKTAIEKKNIDPAQLISLATEAAGGVPIPDSVKKAIETASKSGAFNIAKDIAEKKNVDPIQILNTAINAAGGVPLPDSVKNAFTTGIAVFNAKNIQNEVLKSISRMTPNDFKKIQSLGEAFINKSPQFKQAGNIVKDAAERYGFKIGCGVMSIGGQNENTIKKFRSKLNPKQQKGFDLAVSARIGSTTKPVPKTLKKPVPYMSFAKPQIKPTTFSPAIKSATQSVSSLISKATSKPVNPNIKSAAQKISGFIGKTVSKPSTLPMARIRGESQELPPEKQKALEEFSYFATEGMQGSPTKVEQMKVLASNPISREGAAVGVKTVAERRKNTWQRIKEYFGFHGEQLSVGEFE